MQRFLIWSVESHHLFSSGFRRGVKHVCGLKVALDRQASHQLSNPVWMIIISYLPCNWVIRKHEAEASIVERNTSGVIDAAQAAQTTAGNKDKVRLQFISFALLVDLICV